MDVEDELAEVEERFYESYQITPEKKCFGNFVLRSSNPISIDLSLKPCLGSYPFINSFGSLFTTGPSVIRHLIYSVGPTLSIHKTSSRKVLTPLPAQTHLANDHV